MKISENKVWVYYEADIIPKKKFLTDEKCGKWMYFSKSLEFASELCKKAVEGNIVVQAKHSKKMFNKRVVCCFYLNGDDVEGHIKTIQFFLDNNLIAKTIDGKLYNISFKLDIQTMSERLGLSKFYEPTLTLDCFLDLYTGEWKA